MPPGKYRCVVGESEELIWKDVFSTVVDRIVCWRFLSVSWCLIFKQCSDMQRMSMSSVTCSFANREIWFLYWFVPKPFKFWKAILRVFDGFSSVVALPTH